MITVLLFRDGTPSYSYRRMNSVPRPGDLLVLEKSEERVAFRVLDQPYCWYPDREEQVVAVAVENAGMWGHPLHRDDIPATPFY